MQCGVNDTMSARGEWGGQYIAPVFWPCFFVMTSHTRVCVRARKGMAVLKVSVSPTKQCTAGDGGGAASERET